jgi:ribosome assembly protein 1
VCAGCVCGIGGLGGHILKYATLSSTPLIRPISFLAKATAPVVAVAVEPKQLQQVPISRRLFFRVHLICFD